MAYDYDDDDAPESEAPESEKPKKKRPKKADKQPDPTEGQWWRAKELGKKPHQILDGLSKQIEDDQASRYEAYKE